MKSIHLILDIILFLLVTTYKCFSFHIKDIYIPIDKLSSSRAIAEGVSVSISFVENTYPAELLFKLNCLANLTKEDILMENYKIYKGNVKIKQVKEVSVTVWTEAELIAAVFENTNYGRPETIYPINGEYIKTVHMRSFASDTKIDVKLAKPTPTAVSFKDNKVILSLLVKEPVITALLEEFDKVIKREEEKLEKERKRKILEQELQDALNKLDYSKALYILKEIQKLYPEDMSIRRQIGQLESEMAKKAQEELSILYKKVNDLEEAGKYDEAITVASEILRKYPQEEKNVRELINKLLKKKEERRIKEYYHRADKYEQTGELDKAISTLQDLAKLYPQEKEKTSQKIKHIQKKKEEKEINTYYKKVDDLIKEGNVSLAIATLEELIRKYPKEKKADSLAKKLKAEEEKKRKEEEKRRIEEEKRRAEEEKRRIEEERRKAEEERKKKEEEEKRKAEEEKRRLEEEKKKAEEEKRRIEEEKRRAEEEKKKEKIKVVEKVKEEEPKLEGVGKEEVGKEKGEEEEGKVEKEEKGKTPKTTTGEEKKEKTKMPEEKEKKQPKGVVSTKTDDEKKYHPSIDLYKDILEAIKKK